MKTLISMVDFVEEIKDYVHESHNYDRAIDLIFEYSTFLKKPLTLGMFVPYDEKGNILKEPFYDPANEQYWAGERFMYDTVKEEVLFKGFELSESNFYQSKTDVIHINSGIEINIISGGITVPQPNGIGYGIVKTIEDLTIYEFELTESAKKQIFN